MQRFIPSESDLKELQKSAARLKKANKLFGVAKRESEAAKKHILEWLRTKRTCDVEKLSIGEMVSLEGVILIEIRKQNKFDEKGFLTVQPELHGQHCRDFPVRWFIPLV